MPQARHATPPSMSAPNAGAALPQATQAMLDAAEPLQGAHALVLCHGGAAGLDALCGLIGRGCAAALEVPPDGPTPAEPAEIVLVPGVADLDCATKAILLARRSLLPCGRVVLQTRTNPLAIAISRVLTAAGFSFVRVRPSAEGAVISADWPMFGLRAGAVAHA